MPHIPMEYTVDLGKTINVTPLHTLFAMGDDNAHRFAFSVVQDGKSVDLSGCTVLATYTNFSPHGVTVNLDGKIEDGKAVALLSKACYTMEGRFALVVRLKNSVGTSAIFYGDGYMSRTTSDTVIDGDYIIYDVNTLLEKIAEINEATSSANTAAQNANTAAETANAAASSANTEAQNANTAANTANASAQTADTAAGKIDDMTVSATPVETGTATAALSTVDGHYHLALGLPKGDTGATPQISVQVATGAAGSEASVSVSGTAEEPVIHLTIPRGDTGRIENLTINGKPVESGIITLTAADLGAASAESVNQLKNDKLDKTATAADSAKLGGKTLAEIMLDLYPVGAVYISVNSTSPASLFGGTWEQIEDRFLLAAGSTYAAGSTGGEATHTLKESELPNITGSVTSGSGAGGDSTSTGYGNFRSVTGVFTTSLACMYTSDAADKNTWPSSATSYQKISMRFGGGASHNNMPPYLAVYMWERVS